jgi:5S rRNA maturation endonuclease (ribonuclease M5)
MSHGKSLIIRRSKLSADDIDVLLTAPYFESVTRHLNYTNFFDSAQPTNDIQKTIIGILQKLDVDYEGKKIEYWFQHQVEGQELAPHCDYNHQARREYSGVKQCWLHEVEDKTRIMSPVTIACYLQADNLEGGELCISTHTWFNEPTPLSVDPVSIKHHPHEVYQPAAGDILFFEGSKYYHWIQPVRAGERKSMMINFWPETLVIHDE